MSSLCRGDNASSVTTGYSVRRGSTINVELIRKNERIGAGLHPNVKFSRGDVLLMTTLASAVAVQIVIMMTRSSPGSLGVAFILSGTNAEVAFG